MGISFDGPLIHMIMEKYILNTDIRNAHSAIYVLILNCMEFSQQILCDLLQIQSHELEKRKHIQQIMLGKHCCEVIFLYNVMIYLCKGTF